MEILGTAIRFLLITVLFLSIAHSTYAGQGGDTVYSSRGGLILEAGEISSSTVAAEAFVVGIYGKGERKLVSGKWEQLVTVRGYVKAVDAETLILAQGRDSSPKRALNPIQTLVLTRSPSSRVAGQVNTLGEGKIKAEESRLHTPNVSRSNRMGHLQAQTDSTGEEGGTIGRIKKSFSRGLSEATFYPWWGYFSVQKLTNSPTKIVMDGLPKITCGRKMNVHIQVLFMAVIRVGYWELRLV